MQGWLQLEVSDEGKGHAREVLLQARDSKSGVGISGMRERVEQLGGCLRIDCNGEGTTVIATIPIETGFHG
jgi:signal transduction histidine kinase